MHYTKKEIAKEFIKLPFTIVTFVAFCFIAGAMVASGKMPTT